MTWSFPRAEGSPRASRRPTVSARPATTLYNPQGASLLWPSGFVQFILCVVRPHPLREPSVNSRTTHKILSILGKCAFGGEVEDTVSSADETPSGEHHTISRSSWRTQDVTANCDGLWPMPVEVDAWQMNS